MGHVPPIADIRGPLVGRAAELDRLAGLVGVPNTSGATPTPDGAVLLAGDAGVGKTRLLAELRDRAQAAGWRVAGRALPGLRRQRPALPAVHRGLRPPRRRSPRPLARSLVEAGPAIARLMPGPPGAARAVRRPPTTRAEVHLDRADLFEAVHAALELLGRAEPLLLVVEDVHWADRSTRDLLSFLFSRRFDAPGGDRGVLPQRRPAPPAPAAHRRRRVGPAARRAAGRSSARCPTTTYARLVRALHPGPLSERDAARHRRAGRGQRVLRRGAGRRDRGGRRTRSARRPRRPAAGAPRPARRRRPRRCVRAASVRRPPGAPTCCSPRSCDGQTTSLDAALRAAVEQQRAGAGGRRRLRVPARPAGRGGLRRPAARRAGPAARGVRRGAAQHGGVDGTAAELARHARRGARPARPRSAPASQAGDEAMAVGGPDEAAQHYETALELRRPTDRRRPPTSTWSTLTVKAATAAAAPPASPHRALALARGPAAASCPTDAPARHRAAAADGAGARPTLRRSTTAHDPLPTHHRGARRWCPTSPTPLRARLAGPARPGPPVPAATTRRAAGPLEALELAERLGLAGVVADATTTLAGIDERAGDPGRVAARRSSEVVEQAAPRRRRWPPSCAACSTSAACTTSAATWRRRRRPTPAADARGRAESVGPGRRTASTPGVMAGARRPT